MKIITDMRLLKNTKNLENAIELYFKEQKTPRYSIWEKCLCYFTDGNLFHFNGFDSNAFLIYIIEAFHWIPYVVFALIIISTVTIPILSKFFNIMARCNSLPDRQAIFFTLFEERIRREFHSQSAETMSTIVTAVSHILRPSPERPSILLCLASSDGKETSARIARATASVVMSSFQKPSYDVDKITLNCSNYASSDQFWTFFEDMSERMRCEKVVVLTEFEKINAQVATALCHLADDTYAPFPQSIVIVCLDIGNRFNANQLQRQAPVTLAETFLEEKWDDHLDTVSMMEIFGRLTGRTVLIEREVPLCRLTGSLPSIKGGNEIIKIFGRYAGPQPKLRKRRRQTARSEMEI